MPDLIEVTDNGLFCEAGGFYVDPWRPVERAVITHAHSDHARWGSESYLTAEPGVGVLRERMGPDAHVEGIAYGKPIRMKQVTVSLHPAGHILGSAQVRIEHRGEVWVVSGDYKTEPDVTCAPFEPVRCNTFFSECTFGLPIYRWRPQPAIFADIHAWWRDNQEKGRTSVIFGYSLGKSQRILAGLDPACGPILVHGAVERCIPAYRATGVRLPETLRPNVATAKAQSGKAMVIAPPSAMGSAWMRRFGESSTAMASGWMQIRGARRRSALDRGFVLSDHADWPGLLAAIRATGAEHVRLMHGYATPMARWLVEQGMDAQVVATPYEGEMSEETEGKAEPEEA